MPNSLNCTNDIFRHFILSLWATGIAIAIAIALSKPTQVNMTKGSWRKYSSKFQRRLHGYLEDA